jgi:hypothetical protein
MPLGLLAWLAIEIILFVASALLAPKPNIPDATPEDPRAPRTSEGEVLQVVFGTCKVSANISFFGAVQAHEETEKVKTGIFSSKNVTIGFNYDAIFQAILCHGPVDELVDIVWDQNKSLAAVDNGPEIFGGIDQNFDGIDDTYGVIGGGIVGGKTFPFITPANASRVNDLTPENGLLLEMQYAQGLFGGYKQGGGLAGKFTFYWGVPNQAIDRAMIAALGPTQYNTRYEGVCHCVFGATHMDGAAELIDRFNFGERSILPSLEFIVRRCPSNLGLTAAQTNLAGGANPAEMIYEVLTNITWGLGVPASNIDLASFVVAGTTLATEEFGLSLSLNNDESGDSVITEILRYVDGQVQQHPVTGLIEFTLNRDDYVVADLPVLNSGNVGSCQLTRPTWSSLKNEVRVLYTERRGVFFKQVPTQPIQDIAAQRNFVEKNAVTIEYPGVTNAILANRLGVRQLRVQATPLGKVRLTTNRGAADFRVGRPFLLVWEDFGTLGRVHRVISVDYGTLSGNQITVDAVEDVFALEQPLYAIAAGTPFTDETLGSRRFLNVTPIMTQDPSTGYLTLDLKAGTGLVTSVEFRGISGNRTPGAWHMSESPAAFSATVDKHSYLQSAIEWRVNGHLQNGTIGILADGAVEYDVAAQPMRPNITFLPGTTAGYLNARIEVDSDTVSVKYAVSVVGIPTDATVRAAAPVVLAAGQTVINLVDVVAVASGQLAYMGVFAYDEPGNESLKGNGYSLVSAAQLLTVSIVHGATTASISYAAAGTVLLSINGGAFSAAPASPISVSRPVAGAVPLEYNFKVTVGSETVTNAVTVLPIDQDVVTPDLDVVPSTPTTTTQNFTATTTNPGAGGAPVLTVTLRGTTGTGSGGVGAIANNTPTVIPSGTVVTVNRQPFDTVTQPSIEFKATITGGGTERIQRTVLNQVKDQFGPDLIVTATPSTTSYSIAWSGSGVLLSIDGGAFGTPPASPITVSRNTFGGAVKSYVFKGTQDGRSVTIAIAVLQQADKSTAGKRRGILGASFLPTNPLVQDGVTGTPGYIRSAYTLYAGNIQFVGYAEVFLPDGVTVTQFMSSTALSSNFGAAAYATTRLIKVNRSTFAATVLATHSNTTRDSTYHNLTTTLSEVIDNNTYGYYSDVDLTPDPGFTPGGAQLALVELTYTAPTVTSTL